MDQEETNLSPRNLPSPGRRILDGRPRVQAHIYISPALPSELPPAPPHKGCPGARPAGGSSVEGRRGAPGAGPTKGCKGGEGTGASLLGEKAGGAGPAQPQEETERGRH